MKETPDSGSVEFADIYKKHFVENTATMVLIVLNGIVAGESAVSGETEGFLINGGIATGLFIAWSYYLAKEANIQRNINTQNKDE